jgi:hypothetical protein
MDSKHWTAPNRGKETPLTSGMLNHGQFGAGTETSHGCVVTPIAGHSAPRHYAGAADPAAGPHDYRRNVPLGGDTYGPAGRVQVTRAYADPSGVKQVRPVRSAFGPQDNFRSGRADGVTE